MDTNIAVEAAGHVPFMDDLPAIELLVPKQVFAAMKHLTAAKGHHARISFAVRDDHWIALGTNGQVAGMIRVLSAGLEPCAFSGKFDAVSGLDADEEDCYILKIHPERSLFPMPRAEIIGANGSLMVAVEAVGPAVSTLLNMNADESLFPVTASIDSMERMIKAVKAYNKEAVLQFQPINSGQAIRVILKDDSGFYGVMAASELDTYRAPRWVRDAGGSNAD
jgi:hypothetical protein